jgi:hypothetical protein
MSSSRQVDIYDEQPTDHLDGLLSGNRTVYLCVLAWFSSLFRPEWTNFNKLLLHVDFFVCDGTFPPQLISTKH